METDINVLLERAGCQKVKDTVPQYKCGSRKSGAYIENLENLYLVCREHLLHFSPPSKRCLRSGMP